MNSAPRIPAELWPQVSALFDQAQALPIDQQAAWLAALEASDAVLALHLRGLLAAHVHGNPLSPPDGDLLAQALGAHVQTLATGTLIGVYRLIEPLGRGGMATVWAAEQTQGVLRRVALKLPHPGLEAPGAMAARFERERDLLAGLEHPHIGRLYDAGISAQGQPFLAMELITGVPITQHAARQSVRERLLTFLQVLDAVSFAHGRLVIHRDIKPSNILVTPEGQVKLLDFGIARLLGDAEGPPGVLSGRAFTPDCASPEQLAGAALGVTSDVYSLGVVLFEVLSAARPYRLDRDAAQALTDQLASTRVRAPSTLAAGQRRALLGDLDAIVARAMAGSPQARYPSSEALAADIQRHLNLLPVQARGAGRRYRAGLFLRRHSVAAGAATAVVLALGVGLGVALWQAGAAREQAVRAQAAQDVLFGFFDGVSPQRLRGGEISARELVLQGSERAEARLADQNLLRADLLATSGRLLGKLTAYAAAHEQLQKAVSIYEAEGQASSRPGIQARFMLADLFQSDYQADAAAREVDRVLALSAKALPPDDVLVLRAHQLKANVLTYQGHPEQAIEEAGRVLAASASAAPERPLLELLALNAQGNALLELGRWDEARQRFETIVARAPAVPALELTDLLAVRFNLNIAHGKLGNTDALVRLGRPLLEEAQAHLGAASSVTLEIRSQLAKGLQLQGHFAQAVEMQRGVAERAGEPAMLDDEFRQLHRALLGSMLASAGDAASALPLLRENQAFVDKKYPQPQMQREIKRLWLASALLSAGLGAEAEQTYALAASHLATLTGQKDHPRWAEALQGQALALRWMRQPAGPARVATSAKGAREWAAPRPLLQQACAMLLALQGQPPAPALRCQAHLAWLDAEAAPSDAAALAAFKAAMQAYMATPGAGAVVAAEAQLMQAGLLAAAGQNKASAVLQASGAAAWQQAAGRPWPGLMVALH